MASKSKIYIVLEFVGGGELFDQIVSNSALFLDCIIYMSIPLYYSLGVVLTGFLLWCCMFNNQLF